MSVRVILRPDRVGVSVSHFSNSPPSPGPSSIFYPSYVYYYYYFRTITHLPSTMQIKCYSVCLFDSLLLHLLWMGSLFRVTPERELRTQYSYGLHPAILPMHMHPLGFSTRQNCILPRVRCWYPLPGSWDPAMLPIRQLGSMEGE